MLRADVRAWKAVEQRAKGEPIETPLIAGQEPTFSTPAAPASRGPKGAPTLRTAFEGWKKEGTRASSTAVGYEHALDRWEQLHGDIPVAGPCPPVQGRAAGGPAWSIEGHQRSLAAPTR
jgi:hypothetical protein